MADPIPPLPIAAVAVGLVVLADRIARRSGTYEGTEREWPAAVRVTQGEVAVERPYRAAAPAVARVVVPAGVPAVVSAPTLLAGIFSTLWTVALLLGLGDLWRALSGRRALAFALASLVWCGLRTAAGWATVCAASFAQPRRFVWAALAAGAMDAALAAFPLPCSDVRADDVSIARAGLVVTAVLAAGFGAARWSRRGTVPEDVFRTMN